MTIDVAQLRSLATPLDGARVDLVLDWRFAACEAALLLADRLLNDRWFVLHDDGWLGVFRYQAAQRASAEEQILLHIWDVPLPARATVRAVYRVALDRCEDGARRCLRAEASREGPYADRTERADREMIWHLLQHGILGSDKLGLETPLRSEGWIVLSQSDQPLALDVPWAAAQAHLRAGVGVKLEHNRTGVRVARAMALAAGLGEQPELVLVRPACPSGHGLMHFKQGEFGTFGVCREPGCDVTRDAGRCLEHRPILG